MKFANWLLAKALRQNHPQITLNWKNKCAPVRTSSMSDYVIYSVNLRRTGKTFACAIYLVYGSTSVQQQSLSLQ